MVEAEGLFHQHVGCHDSWFQRFETDCQRQASPANSMQRFLKADWKLETLFGNGSTAIRASHGPISDQVVKQEGRRYSGRRLPRLK